MNAMIKIVLASSLLLIAALGIGAETASLAQVRPILIEAERLALLKQLVSSWDPTWTAFKADLDLELTRTVGEGYQGGAWRDVVERLGLGYLLLRDSNPALASQYADKALVYLMALVRDQSVVGDGLGGGIASISTDSWYATRNVGIGTAIGYDYLYDYPGFTQVLKDEVKGQLELWTDTVWQAGYGRTIGPASNYWWGHINMTIRAGYVLLGDSSKAQGYIDFARGEFEPKVRPYLATIAAGGDWMEGTNYGSSSSVFDFLSVIKAASNEDLLNDSAFGFPKEAVLCLLYQNVPTLGQGVVPLGDQSQGVAPGLFVRANFLKMASAYLTGPEGAYAKYFADNAQVYYVYGVSKFYKFLYNTPSLAALDYRQALPLDYKADGTGFVNSRSGWGANGTSVFFIDGRNDMAGDHQHWYNNSFMIYRNGWQTASAHLYNWNDKSTFDYNNYLIAGMKQNNLVGEPPTSRIERYQTHSDFTYIQGQATTSYNGGSANVPNPTEKWSLEGPFQPAGQALSGGSLPTGTYYYKYAYRGAHYGPNPSYSYNGETLPSAESAAVVTSAGNQRIQLDLGPLPPGASGWAVYRTDVNGASGTELFLSYTTQRNFIDDGSISLGTGAPKTSNSAPIGTVNLLSNYSRNIIHIRPDYVLVFDRISVTDPTYNAELFLQTHLDPLISGNLLTSQEGSGRIFDKILLPEEIEINKVAKTRSWATKINPAHPAQDHIFFNVFYVSDLSVSSMPQTSLIESADMAGAYVEDASNPFIVLFSKTENGQSGASYTVPNSARNIRHLIVGLAPDTYNVYKDGILIDTKTAETASTLYFTANGGGAFLVTAGAVPGIPGDVDGDGTVNVRDLILVAKDFGKTSGFNPACDINKDGMVNVIDLILVARNYGK